MRRRSLFLLFALTLFPATLQAQAVRVSGKVTDQAQMPLARVRVVEKGTLNSTMTDAYGRYELRVSSATAMISFERAGFREEAREPGGATLDVALVEGMTMAALEVVGTRRMDRAPTSTPMPIDIIDVDEVTLASGQLDLNQLLQYVAPSFNSNRQSGADGSDHVDPASLRGLGPDQTLVLINGKRRHQSSLINIFGSRGRGNTGTDLNAIPVAAIDHIEILRDGASAQYGSDAIAGVINIVLKSTVGELNGDVASGFHNAAPPSSFDITSTGTDGKEGHISGNYGIRAGADGFFNITGEYLSKGRTNRTVDESKFSIYRRQYGDAEMRNGGLFINTLLPISGSKAFYAFGGANFRKTDAFAWTREADDDRNVPEIYPNGFDPHIVSSIRDMSLTAGVKARTGRWDVDISSASGSNRFHYNIEKTLNATLLAQSPTEFDAGGFSLFQTETGVRLTRLNEAVARGLNVSLGAQHRWERYSIFAGEEGSYKAYRNDRPAGSQGFPGFQPADEIAETRNNVGAFADVELDATQRLTLTGAARFEHYSDFGNTLTAKIGSRLALSDAVALRGTFNTGFRAPSLAQIYFNSTFTDVNSGVFIDKVIARNTSPIAAALGIPGLKEEKSMSFGLGLTARSGELELAIDAYAVDIDDRIVLTGAFGDDDPDIGDELQALGVAAAQFFTNAIDTETRGLDIVLSHQLYLGAQKLRWSLAGNFNDMGLSAIKTSGKLVGKEDTYFGAREQAFLLASAPSSKITFTVDHELNRFNTQVRVTNFGRVSLIDFIDERDIYKAKATTDISLGYRVSNNARITVGGANIFNVYPSMQDTETETGGLWDAVQMGFSGAFYFAKLSVRM